MMGAASHYWLPSLEYHIQRLLEAFHYESATFLAERLLAEAPCAKSKHLLSLCYYRSNKKDLVLALLDGADEPELRYIYAQCCFELGQLTRAEEALCGCIRIREASIEVIEKAIDGSESQIPNGPSGLALLARIYHAAGNRALAIKLHRISLQQDPFLWSSYEALCALGHNEEAGHFFQYGQSIEISKSDNNTPVVAHPMRERMKLKTPIVQEDRAPGRLFQTPSHTMEMRYPHRPHSEQADMRAGRLTFTTPDIRDKGKQLVGSSMSRSSSTTKPGSLNFSTSFGTADGDGEEQSLAKREIFELLIVLGNALRTISQFMCKESLVFFKQLSSSQYHTSWVLHHVGRCYFELGEYLKAKESFRAMRRTQITRTDGLAVYSTVLWHLKDEVELSFLAQQVSEEHPNSPETWCVVGNCFSLQKDHETAIKFFQRALQIDTTFTYAYTLLGHEYACNEEFDKALQSYRYAIRHDERHYNAWYGIGTIYHRQEKFELAESHFRMAADINSQSSVLQCYLGMVLHSQTKHIQALEALKKAIEIQPLNPQAHFQQAGVLLSSSRYAEALGALEYVKEIAPKEASVFYLMGRICTKLGKPGEAIENFLLAMDLNPKDSNTIKLAIDRICHNDPEDQI